MSNVIDRADTMMQMWDKIGGQVLLPQVQSVAGCHANQGTIN